MELTPEERQRIYLEEKERLEIRRQLEAENPLPPRQPVVPVVVKSRPSNGIAAVLSLFIPGAGQMYKGRIGQGLLWLLAAAFGYMLWIVPGIIVHIICIFNAASDSADEPKMTEIPISSDEIRWQALDDKKF